MSTSKVNLLPRFEYSFFFGETGTIVPFYLQSDSIKSGHFTRGDWVDDILSREQIAKISLNGFPVKGCTVFEATSFNYHNRVNLIFPGKVDELAILFWRAITFLCEGRFFTKQVFLGNGDPSLSHQDRETLDHLQAFFSYGTSFGEERCDMLFDADRQVIIVRGNIGNNVLEEPSSFQELKDHNYPELKKIVSQFLKK